MGWCRPSAVLLVLPPLVRAILQNSTIDGLSQCSYIPYPPRGSYGRPLAVETIFPYTATGTPLLPTRAARAALLARIFGKAARFSLNLLTNSFYLTIFRISTHYGRGNC